MDIDEAAARIEQSNAPQRLVKAACFLQGFRDLIDEISDGWAYWSHGTKCSNDLQWIVNAAQWPAHQYQSTAASQADIDKAVRNIVTFLRRCKQTKDLRVVQDWLQG